MKTYLWCDQDVFEYEFFAANADTLEEARSLVLNKIDEIFVNKVKEAEIQRDEAIKMAGENVLGIILGIISDGSLKVFNSWTLNLLESRADHRKNIIKNDPICLELGEANMFDHANQ